MKYYSFVAFVSALVNSIIGILICRNKLKGFVNIMCKNPERYKILGGYFITAGVIMLGCAFAALLESTASVIYIVFSSVALSAVLSLMRYENT